MRWNKAGSGPPPSRSDTRVARVSPGRARRGHPQRGHPAGIHRLGDQVGRRVGVPARGLVNLPKLLDRQLPAVRRELREELGTWSSAASRATSTSLSPTSVCLVRLDASVERLDVL
jgi:hypothetical protein